jgi:hypothetical protein
MPAASRLLKVRVQLLMGDLNPISGIVNRNGRLRVYALFHAPSAVR